jgi:manganese/zinc/iron transport system substrate-binding protein
MTPATLIFGVLLINGLFFGGCRSKTDSPASGTQSDQTMAAFSGEYPINVVGTVGMVCDLVRSVGGDHIQVTQICGSGVDPHSYVPTPEDVKLIKNADIVFYNGLMLEGKMAQVFETFGRRKPVVAVAESLDTATLLKPDEFEGHFDPHVWMDVSAWSQCVEVIAKKLAIFDPPHAAEYDANAAKLKKELDSLHQYAQRVLATIPEDRRILITSHDAFNYFGRAYGLQVMGVQGISTESEAGVQRINELVDLLVDKKVQAVFTETSVDPSMIEALIEGARNRGHQVTSGQQLFSDAMGTSGTYRGTYIGMLDHNITTVAIGLGGDAPADGFQGKLNDDTIDQETSP